MGTKVNNYNIISHSSAGVGVWLSNGLCEGLINIIKLYLLILLIKPNSYSYAGIILQSSKRKLGSCPRDHQEGPRDGSPHPHKHIHGHLGTYAHIKAFEPQMATVSLLFSLSSHHIYIYMA